VRVCGGAVVLRYRYEDPFVDDVCAGLPGNLTLWSIGNHEIGGDFANITHFTKNNVARHVAYLREGSLCPHAAQHAAACRLWWVSTHQRLNHRPHIRFNVEDHSTIRRCRPCCDDFASLSRSGHGFKLSLSRRGRGRRPCSL
jgi:hypothetical protein